jgi:hypothetical protein
VLLVIEYIFFSLHTRAERFNNPTKKHVLIVVASSKSYDGTEFAHVQLRRKDVLAARIQGTRNLVARWRLVLGSQHHK